MIVECPRCRLRYDVSGRPPGTQARCRCGSVFTLPKPAGEAGSIACPNCGAPCGQDDSKCAFCTTSLATARCPRCFALLFRGAKHCAECGNRLDVPARAMPEQESGRPCPRCTTPQRPQPLTAHLVGQTLIDQCPECGGLWVDQEAFERLTEKADQQQSAQAALGRLPPPRRPLDASASKVVYLRCPDCETVMNRRNYAKRSGVIVDVCQAHGIWFDSGELPRVLAFVRAGGLDESRRKDLEDLKEETARMRHTQARLRAEGAYGSGGFFNDDRLSGGGLLGLLGTLSDIVDGTDFID
jgi:Zn-finger nucleic acid-binding protein